MDVGLKLGVAVAEIEILSVCWEKIFRLYPEIKKVTCSSVYSVNSLVFCRCSCFLSLEGDVVTCRLEETAEEKCFVRASLQLL